ncbi:hypothetical protein CK936_00770 [Streptomyces albireticuli]|uniref:Flavoprotein domain-containing protein n=2 Tax=Streptomyces albireticuli TaxID=1940 RepID=A0A2A2DE58_9ACTN|nr:hypothetical protein CK936_00770 [Streptomyces albireticuli]
MPVKLPTTLARRPATAHRFSRGCRDRTRKRTAVNLVVRAADVTLKERRKLVLVPREAPLNEIHLENMPTLARMGALILPPMPAFYNHPKTIDDIVMHLVARILDHFGLEVPSAFRWKGGLGKPQAELAMDPIAEPPLMRMRTRRGTG